MSQPDMRDEYSLSAVYFCRPDRYGEYRIVRRENLHKALGTDEDPDGDSFVVWSRPIEPGEEDGLCPPPPDVASKYEELIEFNPEYDPGSQLNIVELVAGTDDEAGNLLEPCAFGHRVPDHAVYCHNSKWLYAPRKCRRQADDPSFRHEDCAGFCANPRLPQTSS